MRNSQILRGPADISQVIVEEIYRYEHLICHITVNCLHCTVNFVSKILHSLVRFDNFEESEPGIRLRYGRAFFHSLKTQIVRLMLLNYFRQSFPFDKFKTQNIILAALAVVPFLTAACESEFTDGPSQGPVMDVLKLNSHPGNPRNSEGDFITLNDGRILYIYSRYTGSSSEDNGSAFLAGRYSYDQGERWHKKDFKIIDREGLLNVMSVSLLRLQNGKIALFYLRKNSPTDCIPMMRVSADEGATWSEARPCITDRQGYFVLNNDRVIQLKTGRLVIPVSLNQTPQEEQMSYVGRLYTYYSDDDGRTWKASAEVYNPEYTVLQEPGVVELNNGEILMFARTTAGVQYFSYSKDQGKTWSPVEPGNLASPLSPASIARIPSTGHLLAAWNDNGVDQQRTPLTIAISKDDGKTWIRKKNLEYDSDGYYCYTAIHFVDDHVLLGYLDWSTAGITIKKINLKWVYR